MARCRVGLPHDGAVRERLQPQPPDVAAQHAGSDDQQVLPAGARGGGPTVAPCLCGCCGHDCTAAALAWPAAGATEPMLWSAATDRCSRWLSLSADRAAAGRRGPEWQGGCLGSGVRGRDIPGRHLLLQRCCSDPLLMPDVQHLCCGAVTRKTIVNPMQGCV